MAKNFTPRVSKKNRKTVDLSSKVELKRDFYKMMEDRQFLKGAMLEVLPLKNIEVRAQVRTKFNDSSLKELAENIKVNGLIQPLVVHQEKDRYILICGERRFRAMSLIEMAEAPCFILQDKTHEELMAIQFSENSSREQLHYIDKADGIYDFQKATGSSERKIVAALGISKTEVHRSLLIAKLPKKFKEAAKQYNIEKYVLLELDALEKSPFKTKLESAVLSGQIIKRAQLKKAIREGSVVITKSKATPVQKSRKKRKSATAAMFIKAMQAKSKSMKLDKDTQKLLKSLVDDTKDMIEL
ncbi:MAG: ParB/RepB/Spo0J family partition protein [Bacteriovoracia bacterium]